MGSGERVLPYLIDKNRHYWILAQIDPSCGLSLFRPRRRIFLAFTLRQLQYFVAVAEKGTVSGAAQAMSISQSSITEAIKDLESDLGVSMFDRHPRGLAITHNGHQFLRHATNILASVSDARRSLAIKDDAMTGQLSGGQRQRVALARALVNKPKVLLLDEPLGALDLKLREATQEELKSLQKVLGITLIFVTHDQGEALSMADRVAVFSNGKIVQAGSPEMIYQNPRTKFVADFVGSSNILPPDLTAKLTGKKAWSSIRPEQISIGGNAHDALKVSGQLGSSSFLGAFKRITVNAGGLQLHANLPIGQDVPPPGSDVSLCFDRASLNMLEDAA
ncbi:LysR family transcriptional regulator [Agrobacterium vitis]|nr:LysR family transcriptional regulator [Agrobacterium vitis]